MSDPNTFRDVHEYDGQWQHHYRITTRQPLSVKVELYNWLVPLSNEWGTPNGRLGLHLVMRDTQKQPNHDSVNGVFADDILYEILHVAQSLNLEQQKTLVMYIDEQLQDMIITQGCCPQGRSQRLIQIYEAFAATKADEEFHANAVKNSNKN